MFSPTAGNLILQIAGVALLLAALLSAPGCQTARSTQVDNPQPTPARNDYVPPTQLEMETAASGRSGFIGLPAPDFTLQDHTGSPVSLADIRGKWNVVYFYPKDDTPGCACQANEFTLLLIEFKHQNASIYGISADSVASHQAFRKKYEIEIPLLSDPTREVMTKYGAWTETPIAGKTIGRTIRSTFLIDPDGVIAWHWPEVIPTGHAQRVVDKLTELRQQRMAASRSGQSFFPVLQHAPTHRNQTADRPR